MQLQDPPLTSRTAPTSPGAVQLSVAARRLKQLVHTLPRAGCSPDDDCMRELVKAIKGCSSNELAMLGLQPPPPPTLAPFTGLAQLTLADRLQAVQAAISSLHYNYAAGYHHNVSKKRPLHAILATAAGILMHPMPIKCIEAVFLGLLLTQGCKQLLRLPLGFKSRGSNGKVYRHIVLAVADTSSGRFGALGISRCRHLMDKQLVHASLAELVEDYSTAYTHVSHVLLKVRVGLPVEHDVAYTGPVCWRYCTVSLCKRLWQETAAILTQHASSAVELQQQFRAAVADASAAAAATARKAGSRSPGRAAVGPHITRPHSSLGTRAATVLTPRAQVPAPAAVHHDAHLPPVRSPRRQEGSCVNSSRCCSSPAPAPNAQPARGAQPATLASSSQGPAAADGDASSDEDANDSDSEVNSIVADMRHGPRHPQRPCDLALQT